MRDPPASAPAKVAHKTGKEVDDALDASPYFAKLVEAKHKAGTKAEGHPHIHDDAGDRDRGDRRTRGARRVARRGT